MIDSKEVLNFINGKWSSSSATEYLSITNPATCEVLAHNSLGKTADAFSAVQAAAKAFPSWRETPPEERIQYLFKLKQLLEEDFGEIARITTLEHGKTLSESRGELRRGIENVEVACGIPTLMQGYNLEDVAHGIDESMIRQPLGVVAAVTPFNFPSMIPLWFLPYAIACGNTFVLKPSERVPLTMKRIFGLIQQLNLPAGVVNLVNGGSEVVDCLLDHPDVKAISFVGSTSVAKKVYERSARNGKRVQCQGGAKNHVVILPDADMLTTTQIISDSAFGCAGQRCLAVSMAVTVGDARETFTQAISEMAGSIKVGYGLDEDVQMGPVVSRDSKNRIEKLIEQGASEGAKILIDGRGKEILNYENGHFVTPTILDEVAPKNSISQTEIFGPVLSLTHTNTIEQAIEIVSNSPYGNAASIFTSNGAAARKFRYEIPAGNVGINIGVAAPMAYFPFCGWKDSFLGVLHGQGRDAIDFYTEKKVVIERWPLQWSRKF